MPSAALLSDADFDLAELLGGPYRRFADRIYAERRLIEGAHASSFRVLGAHYARDDRNVYYASGSYCRIVDSPMHYASAAPSVVDRDTFEVLGDHFARDRNRVYWQNDVVHGVKPQTFVVLSEHFARDDQRVVYFYVGIHRSVFEGDRYLGVAPIPLAGASVASFVVLSEWCGKDERLVFWHGAPIAVGDPASFTVLEGDWARSSTQVFFEGEELEGADAATFEVFAGTGFARDANAVYEAHGSEHGNWVTRVEGADPREFVPLGGSYTRRGERIFVGDRELEGADAATFEILADGYARDRARVYFPRVDSVVVDGAEPSTWLSLENGFARSNDRVYVEGEVFPCDPATLRFVGYTFVVDAHHAWIRWGEEGALRAMPNADPETIELVSGVFARDRLRVFVFGHSITELVGADPATFTVDGWIARDARRVYRVDDADVRVIEGADPASFVRLDHLFGKDARHAFCMHAAIDGADVGTFETLGGGYARDRERVYVHEGGRAIALAGENPETFVPPPNDDDVPF